MFKPDEIVFASDIGIKDESGIDALRDKAHWFYCVCEVLEYSEIVGKRLAQLSRLDKSEFTNVDNFNISIEVNAVLLTVLNFLPSFSDLFSFSPSKKCKYLSKPQSNNNFRLQITQSFKNPTFKLLNGLRNALVHRHPLNMRNVRFIGVNNRLGVELLPIEFNRHIHLSKKMIETPSTRHQINFIREEPYISEWNTRDVWFAWEEGKTICFLDCEDLGNGISDFLFNLLFDVVRRNDSNIKELLVLLRKIGSRDIYLPEKHTLYSVCSGYHVMHPFITRLV